MSAGHLICLYAWNAVLFLQGISRAAASSRYNVISISLRPIHGNLTTSEYWDLQL